MNLCANRFKRKRKVTLFKWCLAVEPRRLTGSRASNKPTAVIMSVLRTGINATTNNSTNAILN